MWNLRFRVARYIDCYRALSAKCRPTGVEELIDFCVGSPVLLAQVRSEIAELGKILKTSPPKYSLEIGTNYGGTLFLLCALSAPDAKIISVDLRDGQFGGGYPLRKIPLFRKFPGSGQRLHLIQADSHDAQTLEQVRRALGDNKLDYLFIDADHTYEGVASDFRMYSPLVRPGGMIAFHDIVSYRNETKCEVSRFWNNIKHRHRHLEFVEGLTNGSFPIAVTGEPMETSGIGVLFMPG